MYTVAEVIDTTTGRIVGAYEEPADRQTARTGAPQFWGEFHENELMFAIATWVRDEFSDSATLVVQVDPGRDNATDYPASELFAIL